MLATFNPGKARELAALLAAPARTLRGLHEFAGAAAPEETGATLIENARLKSRAALRLTGLPAIADDTALEVDALGGAPGLHTARFA
ncbi:MAG TPA: non-canonical purine NTP pyrophosphatase, partial [Candidatus Eisenbacteria bacterium]|nr:non-canonical purine NTP pyrophosphatase [Candidatus Eisenbacteria bacterium]